MRLLLDFSFFPRSPVRGSAGPCHTKRGEGKLSENRKNQAAYQFPLLASSSKRSILCDSCPGFRGNWGARVRGGEGGHQVSGEGLGRFTSNKDAPVSYIHDTVPGLGSCRSLGKDTVRWRDANSKKSPEQQDCKSSFYPCCWRTQSVSSGPCALGLGGGGSSR